MGAIKSKQRRKGMANNSSGRRQKSTLGFHPAFSLMEDYLKQSLMATDDELTYLRVILDLRAKRRQPLESNQRSYSHKTSSEGQY